MPFTNANLVGNYSSMNTLSHTLAILMKNHVVPLFLYLDQNKSKKGKRAGLISR